jgi:hypothetical protein
MRNERMDLLFVREMKFEKRNNGKVGANDDKKYKLWN